MNLAQNKKTLLILGIGILGLLGVSASLTDRAQSYALLAGYVLFSFNYLMLAKIYTGVVQASQTGETSSRFRTALAMFTFLKFVGLIGALYLLIVLWKLPGLFIAMGSLVSLFLLTSLLISSYLKSFGSSSQS